jgi:hypothetical protein
MRFFPCISTTRMVSSTGAPEGSILAGAGLSNQGLRVRIAQCQGASTGGPIGGPFCILDVGSNRHSASLEELAGRLTDAAEVQRVIRRAHPQCVNVVNACILVVEENQLAAGARL